ARRDGAQRHQYHCDRHRSLGYGRDELRRLGTSRQAALPRVSGRRGLTFHRFAGVPDPHPRGPLAILIYLLVGLGAGVLSGLFGVGGGVLIVPALVFLVGMSAHAAVGTSLGALLLPVGV